MEYIVEMTGIMKHYKVTKRNRSGMWGAVKGLVKREYRQVRAVDGIDLRVREGGNPCHHRTQRRGKIYHVKNPVGHSVSHGGQCPSDGNGALGGEEDSGSELGRGLRAEVQAVVGSSASGFLLASEDDL